VASAPTIFKNLLPWYQKSKRNLPWRHTPDPYKIWISEIMLQQTQVKTVIPYYLNWIKKFPDLKTLAKSSESKVLKAWEGLGYYSRARNIHDSAKQILEKHNGKFPKTFEDILELKGIGRYTAGAIASIAYDQRKPILDGNVERVLSRVFWIKGLIKTKKNQNKLWELAEEILPDKNCGDFNQALMELGATICKPISADCEICPLQKNCRAAKQSNPESIPELPKTNTIRRFRTALIINHRSKILALHRQEQRLLKGLWELPGMELTAKQGADQKKMVKAIGIYMKKEFDLQPQLIKFLQKSKYGITKYQVDLNMFEVKVSSVGSLKKNFKWLILSELKKLPMVGHQKNILNKISVFKK
jgi:A/G-specific adenine glycosylase